MLCARSRTCLSPSHSSFVWWNAPTIRFGPVRAAVSLDFCMRDPNFFCLCPVFVVNPVVLMYKKVLRPFSTSSTETQVRYILGLTLVCTTPSDGRWFQGLRGAWRHRLENGFRRPIFLRHHLRRVGKAASKQRALGSTTSSSPHLLKWAHLRSIPGDLTRCRRMPSMPSPCSPSTPHRY